MPDFPAHIKIKTQNGRTVKEIQTVKEHCIQTARWASRSLLDLGLEKSAYLAGLIHDMGKSKEEFESYLARAVQGEEVRRGSVNHTAAAVKFLMEEFHDGSSDYRNAASELIAFAAGAHHGMFDGVDENGRNGFFERMEKKNIHYEEASENFFRHSASKKELEALFQEAEEELGKAIQKLASMADENSSSYEEDVFFYIGLLARLLLSSVVDGDRRDAAMFESEAAFPEHLTQEERKKLWNSCLERVEKKLGQFSRESELDRARSHISDVCREAAGNPRGIYRLNVPTGGGKTLSALRFALAHGAKWGSSRIIMVSPLLSILEQNAAVIRQFVQDDSLILEHHSNVVQEEGEDELDQRELLMETWDAPIILTSLVQLLETMFSGKMASVRRFHALTGSIIVIDEIQTVPTKMLSMFSLTLNFLAEFCGATIVLCSATQPCVEALDHPVRVPIFNLVPYEEKYWNTFRRTQICYKGSMSLDEIADFGGECLKKVDHLLIICNKKNEAQELSDKMKAMGVQIYQLSAAMCTAHRRDCLRELRERMENELSGKLVCVATQVIEAGVDISFECVIRLTAGMDSIVQAAGRCNRNAEAGQGVLAPVFVVSCKGEKLAYLREIQEGKDASLALFKELEKNPELYRRRADSDEAIAFYYQKRYRSMDKGRQDFPQKWGGRKGYLLDLLSRNLCFSSNSTDHIEELVLRQAFQKAGSLFEVFDQDTVSVITPYGHGQDLIARLESEEAQWDFKTIRRTLEQAKEYTISLFRYQIEELRKRKRLHEHPCGAFSLIGCYDTLTGFSMEKDELGFLEV